MILNVSGSGLGTIKFIAEYTDDYENFYSTDLIEFPVFVEYGKTMRIPIAQKLIQQTLFEKG